MINNQPFITTSELAKLLKISRIAVFKKIKAGQIQAIKIGRNYAIPKKEVDVILGVDLSSKDKILIDQAVRGTVSEYGEALRLLGKE